MIYMKVGVGGTFDVLHRGHRALLDKAFEVGDEVAIGLTSDAYTSRHKARSSPLEKRMLAVQEYAATKGKPFTVQPIDEPQGTLLSDPTLQGLVVSPETYKEADRLAKERTALGMPPLRVFRVEYVLADDCVPISSTRILEGEVDENGRMLRPMRIAVGSENPVKVHAVENVMRRIYGEVKMYPLRVSASVPAEPWGEEVERGAVERARRCLGRNDYGVGVEAGIFEHEGELYDVQFCAVADKMDRVTIGHGSGFCYPPKVAALLRHGSTIGEAFQNLYGQERTGRGVGAIGYLTHGLLPRSELTEQAVVAAMVPRIRKELYFEG
ncbi:MAG: inosine/xanthosine triphosphatase [Methanomassiliicoccales archaeon]|nr:inosine/xanthosine triphosphatase [Methanomassiliicoccales archaeon]